MYENQNQSNHRGHIAAIIMALIIGILGTLWNLNNQKLRDSETVTPSPAIGSGLTVHFIDVGQGDSILLTCGKQTMLVDAGSETAGGTVVDYLRAQGVTKIDYLVSTHPHRDHCGGLAEVVQNYPVKAALSPVTESENEYFSAFTAAAAKAQGITRAAASVDKAAALGRRLIYVSGNAPTALLRICEHHEKGDFTPDLVIAMPVGFVNVVQSKELLIASGIPCIAARGRKGGSSVAAAVINAMLYELDAAAGMQRT